MGIAAVGVLAGSVIAPIAKGTAATAWSGLSGATNAFQVQMDEVYSASINIKRRALIVKLADVSSDAYLLASKDWTKQIAISIIMARKCSGAAAVSDQSSLKALAGDVQEGEKIPTGIAPPATASGAAVVAADAARAAATEAAAAIKRAAVTEAAAVAATRAAATEAAATTAAQATSAEVAAAAARAAAAQAAAAIAVPPPK